LAILAKISTAFENAISECLHFQLLNAIENGGASCPAGIAELISASLMATANVEDLQEFLQNRRYHDMLFGKHEAPGGLIEGRERAAHPAAPGAAESSLCPKGIGCGSF
jgi:hypothetical protein